MKITYGLITIEVPHNLVVCALLDYIETNEGLNLQEKSVKITSADFKKGKCNLKLTGYGTQGQ